MARSRIITTLAATALGIALLGACSAESLTEFGLERALEASADGDVDIDFSDGGFAVEGEDGTFSINFDEDNGGIFFDSDEGSGSILFDDDGNIVYDTDEGSGTIAFDQDNGTIAYDTDEGSGTVTFSDDGIVVDGEGTENDATVSFGDNGGATLTDSTGSVSYFGATERPNDWPAIIAAPQSNVEGESSYSAFGDGSGTTYTAAFVHDAREPHAQNTIDRLLADGFTSQFMMETPEGTTAQLSNGTINVTVLEDGAGSTVVMLTA